MLDRRLMLAGSLAALSTRAHAARVSGPASPAYQAFLNNVRSAARAEAIRDDVINDAFSGLRTPNRRVIALDRRQPEGTLTWHAYKNLVLTKDTFEKARINMSTQRDVLKPACDRYDVDPDIIIAIWGLESSFGRKMGKFNIFDALATLAYEGRRRRFFRAELIQALHILDREGLHAADMSGSYAGAMGQPQFMPSAYLRFAADGDGDGVPDIWHSRADVFASIAKFLHHFGWQRGRRWGYAVTMTKPLPVGQLGRRHRATDQQWSHAGVIGADGEALPPDSELGAIITTGEVTASGFPSGFVVYDNFMTIRHYNPADFYALAVGLIADEASRI